MERYMYSKTEFDLMERAAMPFAIYQMIDMRVVPVVLSQGFLDVFGYEDRDEAYLLMENDMYRDTHHDDVARISEAALRFSKGESGYNVVYRTKAGDGYKIIHAYGQHVYPEEDVQLAIIWYVDEGAYVGNDMVHDDSLTKNYSISLYESTLERKTNFDYLTGLPNMTYFFELARAARNSVIEEGGHCALGFININGMKHFNKKYGFSEGDRLLQEFSSLLAKHFGSENSCRLAQDNFAFFSVLDGLADNLEELFDELEVLDVNKKITIRVGIYTDDVEVVESSLACDRAKFACNTIKDTSVSTYVFFDRKMLSEESHRQYIIDNIDTAIEQGWVKAYFQPIVRAANGRVCDEETLARWIDPVKGFMSPAEFIPILEDEKLIYKLDLCMLDFTIKKMKAQEARGLYVVPASINLSRTDFDSCDIVKEICNRVDASGFDRGLFTIELTESVVGSDFEFIKTQVERFQKLGFKVWMDDFGSGYSSLDVLQEIHFDLIKFDMRFMKQFSNGEKSRIILTELMKMATGLNIETVAEGVETPEQVDFLREIGCTKLQGFHYCKPVSFEEILDRYDTGRQIGFENPDESGYYESIGRINLYDIAIVTSEDSDKMNHYFNTLPMAIFELDSEGMKLTRCNQSYRSFMTMVFGDVRIDAPTPFAALETGPGSVFARAIKKCAEEGTRTFINERVSKDSTMHAFISRIAKNPVTGVIACSTVVLGLIKDTGQGITYADIANSLSADYMHLYYVNMESEAFTEYTPDSSSENLSTERHGTNFFTESRRDAESFIYKDDVEWFVKAFRKEVVEEAIKRHGTFTLTYRLMVNGEPTYVSMKAIPMSNDPGHVIIGISNIDAQMKQQEAIERMQEEQITYARISALAGDYICIYTVDPENDTYSEYSSNNDYQRLGLAKIGVNFFNQAISDSQNAIHPDDKEMFRKMFTKENVLRVIKESGLFILYYRLIMDGKPTYVSLRAALIDDKDGPQLLVGINNIDSQILRDREYNKYIKENVRGE